MNGDINGWSIIEHYLALRSSNQSRLAHRLGISAPAITQAKQGAFSLSSKQLAAIARYLDFTPEDRDIFYTVIFNARIIFPDDRQGGVVKIHKK